MGIAKLMLHDIPFLVAKTVCINLKKPANIVHGWQQQAYTKPECRERIKTGWRDFLFENTVF